ncbi:MAG: J domain-containing protein [Dehalococcoidales bacterium]
MNFIDIDKARKTLNLGELATIKEIKANYRKLAVRHHPDKKGAEESDEMMKELNQAYKVLLDYCAAYKYSFKEDAVANVYPYEEQMRKWKDNWFDSI